MSVIEDINGLEETTKIEENPEEPGESSQESSKCIEAIGEPLQSVAHAPKVKLEISRGPAPPMQNYEPLPYGRRKKRRCNDENAPQRVKLVISGKRLHPGTKSNNILLEPLTEIQERVESPEDEKPRPKFRRKRRAASDDVPLSMTPSVSILDAFEDAFDDTDDGFTTIKDLAERGVTKMEPLDYNDDYDENYYDEEESYVEDFKQEAFDEDDAEDEVLNDAGIDEETIKEEPLEYDEDEPLSFRGGGKKKAGERKGKRRRRKKKIEEKEPVKEESDEDNVSNGEEKEAEVVVKKRKRRPRTTEGGGESNYKPYKCLYCDYFGKKEFWVAHLKKEHEDKNLVFCPVKKCQMPFESEAAMRDHEENTHIKNICTFEGCGKEFKFRSVLREHRKTHYPPDCDWMADPDPDMTIDRFFVCTYCGKRYRTRAGWRSHEAHVHTKQLDYQCDEPGCTRSFWSESELKVHKRRHLGEMPFTCSFCGNRYASSHSLAQHEKAAHLLTEDVECEVCNKKVRKRNLPAHVKTHSEFKGLPCKFCSKEFPTIGSLKRHEKIHMEVKEHKCRFCGKSFVQKANMQAHERIHTGERPYKCQFCNEGFVQSTRRRQHEATCKMKRLAAAAAAAAAMTST